MLEKATMADFMEACEVYRAACENMEREGLDLWHWGVYPTAEIVEQDIRRGWLYLWREDETVLGVVCINRLQAEEYASIPWAYEGEVGLFHRIAVSPKAQGKGLAQKMLACVEDILRAQSCTVLRGDVYSGNPKALRLYDRMGMRQAGQFRDQWCPEPFVALEKAL